MFSPRQSAQICLWRFGSFSSPLSGRRALSGCNSNSTSRPQEDLASCENKQTSERIISESYEFAGEEGTLAHLFGPNVSALGW